MACTEGCNGKITKFRMLDWPRVQYILEQLSGKIFTVWGSLKTKATAPLHLDLVPDGNITILEGSVDEAGKDEEGNYTSGVMSAEDKEKLDGISVSGVTEGNGLSVDDDGTISMSAATETEAGAMSAEDKTFLDGLSGALGALTVVATDVSGNIMGINGVSLLFGDTETRKTFYLKAYKDGAKVDITETSWPTAPFSREGINDGVLTIVASRSYALTVLDASTPLTIFAGSSSTRIYLSAKSDSQCYDVLKGQVYVANNEMTATLWTFDGSEAAIRYVRAGAYWVNLPESWKDVLGDFDEKRLFVQVTMAGENVAAHVYCGRFDPGEEYSGDTASTDCWGAILVLTNNKDEVAVDGSFYINVAYMPSVETYEAENESNVTYKLRVDDFYYTADGTTKNTVGYEGGTLRPVLSLVMDKYVDDVLVSSEAVEPETVAYRKGGGPDDLTFDSDTGYVTFARNVHGDTQTVDMVVDVTALSPNGELLEADAQILNITQEASPTYIQIESFSYPSIPAEGGTFEPSAISVYYHDTSTGSVRGVTSSCAFKYSSLNTSIATMTIETTGEMEVKANDTGATRTFSVTVEATYTYDGVTYVETEIIQVTQSTEGGDIDTDKEAEEAEEALQLSIDSGYKMLATGSNTKEASTGTSNPILSDEYVLPAGCSLKLSAKESTFELRCQEGSDSQFDEPLEKSAANVAVGVYIGGSETPTYSLGGGSVSGSGTAGEDTYSTCNLSNTITVPTSDVDRVVRLGIAVTAMELRYMCNIYLTTDIHLSAEVTVD